MLSWAFLLFLQCILLHFHVPLPFASIEAKQIPDEKPCSDFNYAASAGAMAGLENTYVCPFDGVAQVYCNERFPIKSSANIKSTQVSLSDVLFYVLVGPKSKADAFKWWLPLLRGTVNADIVLIADPCPDNKETCSDGAASLLTELRLLMEDTPRRASDWVSTGGSLSGSGSGSGSNAAAHKGAGVVANFVLLRVDACDVGYDVLSCKTRRGQRLAYTAFPHKLYYFKFDTDTIIFPGRLQHFLQTLDATHMGGGIKLPAANVSSEQNRNLRQVLGADTKIQERRHEQEEEMGQVENMNLNAHTGRRASTETNDAATLLPAPIYFGAVRESGGNLLLCGNLPYTKTSGDVQKGGLCYAQGGAGYGLNNRAMSIMAAAPPCTAELNSRKNTRDTTPEDTFTALHLFKSVAINVIHCGGFDSSEVVNERKLRNSITFHYIDSKWLQQHGPTALKHYHHHNNARGIHAHD